MNRTVHICKVICPDCGTIYHGFIGGDEDNRFYCGATIEIKRGNKTSMGTCGYDIENVYDLPKDNYEIIKTIKIEDYGFR